MFGFGTLNPKAKNPNVNLTFINGVVIVIFAGPERPSPRLLSITGGFRADVCKQVYIGGSDENNNGVTTVKFGWPGIESFTENGLRVPSQRRLFS